MSASRREAFTLVEITAALAILAVVMSLVAQLGFWSLRERLHTRAKHLALESADNALEAAHATPWEVLTPAWAAAQKLPRDAEAFLPEGKLTVRVQSENSGTRRVTAMVGWQAESVIHKVELTTLIGPRAGKGGLP